MSHHHQDVPFFRRPDFFPSPEKSFDLPVYAEEMAEAFIFRGCSRRLPRHQHIDPRVLDFVDVEVLSSSAEVDSHSSSSSEHSDLHIF